MKICGYGVLFCLAGLVSNAQTKRAWTIADSFRLKSIADLQVNAAGDRLFFVVSERDLENNGGKSSIWMWSKETGEYAPLTAVDGSASSPRLSPDEKKLAFFSSEGGGSALWTMSVDGSGKQRLAEAAATNAYLSGGGNRISWSPDGKQLAFVSAGEPYYPEDVKPPYLPTGNEVMIIDRLLHKGAYYYSDLRRMHVWTIPATGGTPRQLSGGDYDYQAISWSPKGDYIACVSNRTGFDDFNANNDVFLLPVAGGDGVQITHTIGPEYRVDYSPDGDILAYHGRVRSQRSKESDAEFMKVYTMPTQGGDAAEITKSVDRWCNQFTWDPHGEFIYFVVQNQGGQDLYRASVDGEQVEPIVTDHEGQVGAIAVSAQGDIYYVYENFTEPSELFVTDVTGNERKQLTELNRDFSQEVAIADAEHFSFRTPEELTINGWIMKPYGFQPGKRYPLVLDIHGGPHSQYGYRVYDRLQEFAANGYCVLIINPRGSTDQGQAFSDAVVGDLAGGDFRDIMTGVDYALGRYDFIDPENMGLTGISYGGYLTNWIITQTHRFKAAVPISGLSNLISAWSEGCNSDWFETDMGFKPYEDYDRAWQVSPLKYIQGCATPTLFINGRWDFITTVNQADAMFVALKKMGVDTQIALYPEEGHGIRRQPKHAADYHQRTIDWFDKYLKTNNP